MALTKKDYKKRLIDKELDFAIQNFGAISLEGPKWCGKTWTALNHANSVIYMDNPEGNFRNKNLAKMDVNNVFYGDYPELIDEWQIIPEIWDAVRFRCDQDKVMGKYILTGSATQNNNIIEHSGAGRIARYKMGTMSLFESGDSSGDITITDLFNNNIDFMVEKKYTIQELAYLIIRGGWPENIGASEKASMQRVKKYIEDVLSKDINTIDGKERDKNKFKMLLKSLSRNESTLSSNETLIKDIIENDFDSINRDTVGDYMNVMNRLYLIENQDAFNPNIRSRDNIGKSAKRHFTDPSFACALLNLNTTKMLNDLHFMGLLFEALVERDLRIYMNYNNGELRHFRNNTTGQEVDAILVNEDGDYGAIEIKLGANEIENAKESLINYYNSIDKKPKFMAIIAGNVDYIAKDKETGIIILPITALKP